MGPDEEKVRTAVQDLLQQENAVDLTERQIREKAQKETGVNTSTVQMKALVKNLVVEFLGQKEREAVEPKDGGGEAAATGGADKDQDQKSRNEESRKVRKGKKRAGGKEAAEGMEDGEKLVCELSNKRRVVVSRFKGQLLVSIREYYEKNGEMLPTAKGISLAVEQWEALHGGISDIEDAIKSLQ